MKIIDGWNFDQIIAAGENKSIERKVSDPVASRTSASAKILAQAKGDDLQPDRNKYRIFSPRPRKKNVPIAGRSNITIPEHQNILHTSWSGNARLCDHEENEPAPGKGELREVRQFDGGIAFLYLFPTGCHQMIQG
jgi:hypothetical protein